MDYCFSGLMEIIKHSDIQNTILAPARELNVLPYNAFIRYVQEYELLNMAMFLTTLYMHL